MRQGVLGVFKSNVIVQNLIPYLSVLDYIQLRRTQRFPKGLITPAALFWVRLLQRIRRDFQLSEEVALAFEKLFTETDLFYLTGGYLISVLRGDPFVVGQDIDLCYTQLKVEEITVFSTIQLMDEFLEYQDYLRGIKSIGFIHGIQFIEHYKGSSIPIDINRFDMNICRNMFHFKEGLKCKELDLLTHRVGQVDLVEWVGRILGYFPYETLKFVYEKLSGRAEKYRSRGFEIKIKIGTKEEVYPLFVVDPDDMPDSLEDNQNWIFDVMGKHNPDSCVYTKDCKCKRGDQFSRWCSIIHACDCEHHMAFLKEYKEQWSAQRAEKLWKEYQEFWKN